MKRSEWRRRWRLARIGFDGTGGERWSEADADIAWGDAGQVVRRAMERRQTRPRPNRRAALIEADARGYYHRGWPPAGPVGRLP